MSVIHAESQGQGLPVVLIHGFCETSTIWNPLVKKLALTNKVITIDLPGFGQSPLPKHPFSLMDIAEMVHDHLDENNLLNSILIGHSLGGYVILAMMERHHRDYQGFGLFHSTSFADDDEKKKSRNKTIEFVKERGVQVFADSFVRQLFYVKNRDKLTSEIKEVTATAAATNRDTLIQYMEAMRDRPDRSSLLNIEKPVLFIAGDQDTSVPLTKSKAQFELINNPHINVLKDVGHMGMYENTTESYITISQFLSSFTPTQPSQSQGTLPDRDLKKNLGCG